MQSLQKKAAQVIFPRLGSNMPPPVRVREDFDRFCALQETYQFGGLVLFNGHKTHTPPLLKALQEKSEVPLLVASDIERGAGQQIEGATLFPHAMACGQAGAEAVKHFARITAEEALACGIHIAFTPVADVNSNPLNPIIGIRSFGDQTLAVNEHVKTFIAACQAAGLLTTAKHFPGHGDTATDSHKELPVVASDFDALSQTELPPFTTAIASGVDLIMTAHVSFPALDASEKPATLSKTMLTDILRNQLGFEGAIISDSLIMKAIQPSHGSMAQYAADLLNAGLDILLDPIDPIAMHTGVVEAVEQGLLSETRLDEAIEQIHALRTKLTERFGPSFFQNPAQNTTVGGNLNLSQAKEVAGKAIKVQKGSAVFCPGPQEAAHHLALYITPYRTRLDPTTTPVETALKEKYLGLNYVEVDAGTSDDEFKSILEQAQQSEGVLALVVSKPAAWHNYGLPDGLHQFVEQLTKLTPTTLVSLGDAHILKNYPSSVNQLCTFSDVPASQEALVRLLDT